MLTERDLVSRTGPVLSDGTTLRELIDFDRREVSMRVLHDPDIHRLELKRIWARSWVGVAHEAEIPNPGDFVLRSIGEDPVIVTRDADGEIYILLNVCAHRGMEVCWADEGNARSFKCPYHGWVFESSGNLLGAPFEQEMYGDWDKSGYGLRRARVGVHRGQIFGNFDLEPVDFDEWIGDAAWYMDLPRKGEDPELEVHTPIRRFRVRANWKIAADNTSGDTYHSVSLHDSIQQLGILGVPIPVGGDETKIVTRYGHGLLGFSGLAGLAGDADDPAADPYKLNASIFTCVLFPATFGLGGANNVRFPGPAGPVLMVKIGGLVPCGPDEFELWSAGMIEKSAPEEFKQFTRRAYLTDIGGADDYEAWPAIQRRAGGALGAEQTMKYNAVAGPSRPDDWPGPGTVFHGPSRDDSQWCFWLRWFEMMTDERAM
jgi:nitrite reductase/ring-hydroxylating ferredoxin subunit